MPDAECTESLHRLYHYLDGELTVDVRTAIERHLTDCPPCGEAFDFEVELRAVISRKCRDQAPDSLRRRIAEAIDHERLHPGTA